MGLRGVLAELRHRGVLKVAAAYAAIGWVALQGLSLLFQSFGAPGWVIKVVTTLVILGFPVACLMSWGFDITPGGVRPIPPASKPPAPREPSPPGNRRLDSIRSTCLMAPGEQATYKSMSVRIP